jgi:hypothetical protein
MSITEQITVGMAVYGFDKLPIGPVEGVSADGIEIGGRQISGAAIDHVTTDAVHLKIAGGALLARHDEQTERAGALP